MPPIEWKVIARRLRQVKTHGFSFACLVLAIGIGTTAAIAYYSLVVKALPYSAPDRLVVFNRPQSPTGNLLSSYGDLKRWQSAATSLDVAGFECVTYPLRTTSNARLIKVGLVTANFFDVLQPPIVGQPHLGDSGSTVVLSARLSNDLATANNGVLPSSIEIGSKGYQVTAIAGADISFLGCTVDAWLEVNAAPAVLVFGRPQPRYLTIVGRLKPDVTLDYARAGVRNAESMILSQAARTPPKYPADLSPLKAMLNRDVNRLLITLLLAGAIILVATITNMSSLMIASAAEEDRAVALRIALGARVTDMAMAYVLVATITGVASALCGSGVAWIILEFLVQSGSEKIPRLAEITLDSSVMPVSFALAFLATVVSGAIPIQRLWRFSAVSALRHGIGNRVAASRGSAGLLVLQVTSSVVVLTSALALVKTATRLERTSAAIRTDGIATIGLVLGEAPGVLVPERGSFVHDLLLGLGSIPTVDVAGMASGLPPATSHMAISVQRPGGDPEPYSMTLISATPGFLEALGLRPVRGRFFLDSDALTPPGSVALISESAAKELFRDRDPIGSELQFSLPGLNGVHPQVVGVADDLRYEGLDKPLRPAVYVPWQHLPVGDVQLVFRCNSASESTMGAIHTLIRRIDPRQPLGASRTLREVLASDLAPSRFTAGLVTMIGIVVLMVATLGIVSLQAVLLIQRQHDLCIRFALGSSSARLLAEVARGWALATLAGLILGITAAAITQHLLMDGELGSGGFGDSLTATLATLIVLVLSATLTARRAISEKVLLRSLRLTSAV